MQQAYWMSLSEEERLRRCGELFALAKLTAEERARADFSHEEKKRFVFSELYGFDMPTS
jgi:hypothetical protein